MNNSTMLLENMYLVEDLNVLQEGFGDFVKRMASSGAGEKLKNKLKNVKDVATFKKVTKNVPKLGPKKAEAIAKKKIPNFSKKKNTAQREFSKAPKQIQAPLANIVATAAKDDGHARTLAKQINKQVTDWQQVNANLVVGIIFSVVIAALFSAMGGAPFLVYLAIFLMIDFIFYIIDILTNKIDDEADLF